jgi:hypothetical protein
MRNILSKKAYTLIPSQSGSRLSVVILRPGCFQQYAIGWMPGMSLSGQGYPHVSFGAVAVTFHTFHQPLLSPWVRDAWTLLIWVENGRTGPKRKNRVLAIFGEPNLTHPTCFCGINRLELLAGVHLSAAELGKLLREQRINLDYMSCGPQWLCPWNPCATTANPETESGWYSSWGYYQLSGLAWMIPLPQSKKPFPSVIIHTFQDWT